MGQKKVEETKVGERIKQLRKEKGLSLQEMATRSGFSSAMLSQIENHLISPPLGALIKLAKALAVEVGQFFSDQPTQPFTIVRKDERKIVSRFASKEGIKYGYIYESLGVGKKNRKMEPFFITLEPATIKTQQASTHDGEEFILVLEGEMEVQFGDHSDILYPGDSIYYDSMVPHLVRCHGDKEAKIVAVLYTRAD